MKLLVISSCSLPVPAVKGGAVETLIETFITVNEDEKRLDIDVISVDDEVAKEKSCNYDKTKFYYLNKPVFVGFLDKILTRFIAFLKNDLSIASRNYIWKIFVLFRLSVYLRGADYDAVIIENCVYLLGLFKSKKLSERYSGKLFFHAHNELHVKNYSEQFKLIRNVITVSDYVANDFYQRYNVEQSDLCRTVYNGISSEKFSTTLTVEKKNELLDKHGISKNDKIILFSGRLAPEKGILELIQAYSSLIADNIVLLIVGSSYFGSGAKSKFEKKLKSIVSTCKNKIVFTGFIDYSCIQDYYCLADFAVLPSVWAEPLGLSMLEAAAAGLPIISTVSGGIPESLAQTSAVLLNVDEFLIRNLRSAMEDMLEHLGEYREVADKDKLMIWEARGCKLFYRNMLDVLSRCDH